jgi:tetratricopeptide (TPR) repeat protein
VGAHLERGRVLYHQDRYDEALQELVRELADDPDCAESHALSALALQELGRGDEAIEAARRAVRAEPELAFPHHVHAEVLYHLDRNAEAQQAIAEALRIDPEEPGYHALRAAILFDEGKLDAALRAAERGLAHDAEHVGCLNLRSMALTRLGRREEAQAGLAAALAANPDSAVSHANRGWTYLHSAQPREALEHFSEALRLDPANEWARAGLIEALKARNLIYRGILSWYLFSERLSARARWGLILGLMFGARILRDLLRRNEALVPIAALVTVAYVSIIYLSWVAVPLFNLMLLLDKLGRHALSREQRSSAFLFGGSLVLAIAVAALSFGAGRTDAAAALGLAALALGIPVASVSMMGAGVRRALGRVFIGGVAAALVFGALLPPLGLDAEHPAPILIAGGCFLACLLSTWVISLTDRG